jgi:hypothetical protein
VVPVPTIANRSALAAVTDQAAILAVASILAAVPASLVAG